MRGCIEKEEVDAYGLNRGSEINELTMMRKTVSDEASRTAKMKRETREAGYHLETDATARDALASVICMYLPTSGVS